MFYWFLKTVKHNPLPFLFAVSSAAAASLSSLLLLLSFSFLCHLFTSLFLCRSFASALLPFFLVQPFFLFIFFFLFNFHMFLCVSLCPLFSSCSFPLPLSFSFMSFLPLLWVGCCCYSSPFFFIPSSASYRPTSFSSTFRCSLFILSSLFLFFSSSYSFHSLFFHFLFPHSAFPLSLLHHLSLLFTFSLLHSSFIHYFSPAFCFNLCDFSSFFPSCHPHPRPLGWLQVHVDRRPMSLMQNCFINQGPTPV